MVDLNGLLNMPARVRNSLSDPNFRAYINADEDEAEILISGTIGDDWGEGVTAAEVVDFLNGNKGRDITMRVNSPGGLVFDGLQMYNAFSQHSGMVTAVIEGLAFSAASFVPMAADKVKMYEASNFGIHRAMGLVLGNVSDMRDAIEWLSRIDETLVTIYEGRTEATRDQINKWLDGEVDGTVFSAAEAFEAGFVDEVIPVKQKVSNQRPAEVLEPVRTEASGARLAALRAKLDMKLDNMLKTP